MNRVLSLTVFLLKDFSRSLRVVVPPGLLLALYRVFFQYGGDVQYFGAVGSIMLGFICIVTALLTIGLVDRASTYPLLARLPRRSELIAAVALATLVIMAILSLAFVLIIIAGHAVPLQPLDLLLAAARWLVLFLFLIAFALHMSRFVTRFGSNLVAYLLLILSLVSYQRVEYPAFPFLDWLESAFSIVMQPLTALMGSGADLATLPQLALALLLTLLYSLLLYALAVWLFRRKDLVWAE